MGTAGAAGAAAKAKGGGRGTGGKAAGRGTASANRTASAKRKKVGEEDEEEDAAGHKEEDKEDEDDRWPGWGVYQEEGWNEEKSDASTDWWAKKDEDEDWEEVEEGEEGWGKKSWAGYKSYTQYKGEDEEEEDYETSRSWSLTKKQNQPTPQTRLQRAEKRIKEIMLEVSKNSNVIRDIESHVNEGFFAPLKARLCRQLLETKIYWLSKMVKGRGKGGNPLGAAHVILARKWTMYWKEYVESRYLQDDQSMTEDLDLLEEGNGLRIFHENATTILNLDPWDQYTELAKQIDFLTVEVKAPQGVNPKEFFSEMKGTGKGKGKGKGKIKEEPRLRQVGDYPSQSRLLVKIRATKLYQDRWLPLFFHIKNTVLAEIGGQHTEKSPPAPYLRDWNNQIFGRQNQKGKGDAKGKGGGKKGGAKGKVGGAKMTAEAGKKGADAKGGGFSW